MSRARYKGVWELAPGKFVYPQTDEYKANGRKIAVKLGKLWSPPRYFYHYRDGGHIAALRVHEPNEFKATIDLEAFFDHVTRTCSKRSWALHTLWLRAIPYPRFNLPRHERARTKPSADRRG